MDQLYRWDLPSAGTSDDYIGPNTYERDYHVTFR